MAFSPCCPELASRLIGCYCTTAPFPCPTIFLRPLSPANDLHDDAVARCLAALLGLAATRSPPKSAWLPPGASRQPAPLPACWRHVLPLKPRHRPCVEGGCQRRWPGQPSVMSSLGTATQGPPPLHAAFPCRRERRQCGVWIFIAVAFHGRGFQSPWTFMRVALDLCTGTA